jgi:enoyl-CoA hydratase/carnithine racemase
VRVVPVDAAVLVNDASALRAEVGDGTAEPTLLRFEGVWPQQIPSPMRDLVATLPALTVATGDAAPGVADAFDVRAPNAEDVARVQSAFECSPAAAVAAALLVRREPPDTWSGLVAESTTYSLLQSGPDFARWRASRGEPRPARDEAPRVRVERHGDVTEIVLARPARHNALDTRMRDELHAALTGELESRTPIIVRGDGPSFCSGGDLDEFGTFPDPLSAHIVRLSRSLAGRFAELAPRVVVGVHGACLGAGIELPAFAARVVASDDARLGLPELGLGLVPGAGGTVSIPRRIGRQRFLDLLLRDGSISASDALEWGLVDEVVACADLEARLLEIAESAA